MGHRIRPRSAQRVGGAVYPLCLPVLGSAWLPASHPHHSVAVVLLYKDGLPYRATCSVDAKARCRCHAETCRGTDHPTFRIYTPVPSSPQKEHIRAEPPGAGEEGPGRQSSWVLTPRGRFLIKEERGPISVGQDSPQILLDLLKKTPDQNFGFLLLNLILWVD